MLSEDAPAHHYRPQLNPTYVRAVRQKRERERQIEGAERRAMIKARNEALKQAVASARAAIREAKEAAEARALEGRVPVRDIIAHIAALHCLKPGDLTGPRRMKNIVEARHEAVRVVADLRPDLSLPQIGRAFNKDHTTILHALRKTKQEGQNR